MRQKRNIWKNRIGQWTVVLFFPAAFLLTAFFSGMGPGTHRLRHMAVAFGISAVVILLVLFWLILTVKEKDFLIKLKKKLWRERYLYAVLLIAGILRSFSLNTMQRWDAGEYYYKLGNACENFDFTLQSFFEQFRLCGHPTLGFAPIYAIGDFLFPRKIIGMELMNLALTLAAIFCIFRIFEKILPQTSNRRLGLYTLLVSCGPLFLGTFQNFNPDSGIALFAVFVICSCLYRQYFLMFFWSCVVIQTKETGIVMKAGLVLGLALYDFCSEKGRLSQRVLRVVKNPGTWIAGISVLLQLGYMKLIGGLTSWASEDQQMFQWDNHGLNCFGFRPDFVITKLKEFFLLNFNWIYVLVIAVGLLLLILNRKKRQKPSRGLVLLWSVGGCLLLFLILYITGALTRYNLFCDLVLAMTGIVVIEQCFPAAVRYIVTIPCLGLMLAQSFFTIDPVSRLVFPQVNTGAVSMVYTQMPSEEIYYGDTIVYNHQYTFIDKALDNIFAETYKGGDMNVVHFGGSYGDGSQFNGNFWQDWIPYKVRWDKKYEKRVHYKSEDTVRINVFGEEWLIQWFERGTVEEVDEAVLIFLPQFEYDEEECLKKLEPLFEIGEKKTWKSTAGCVDYYEIKAR